MKIVRADHLGMCFGVRDAIGSALRHAQNEPLTVLGELAHNETVLASLRARGVQIEDRLSSVTTRTVMVTAHGASARAKNRAAAQGLRLLEATCPLVELAHRSLGELVRNGYHPVVIGRRDHVEVRGLTEDLAEFDVLLSDSDVAEVVERSRFGVIAQTTQPIDHVRHMVALIRDRFPQSEVRFIDTVCLPTKQRQAAAVELAQQAEVVVVIGGAHSNNTRELVATCRHHCAQVYPVQTADDLSPAWFAGVETVGITAGTSTPDSDIEKVQRWLEAFGSSARSFRLGFFAG